MAISVDIQDNTAQVLADFKNKKEKCLEMLGLQGERNAVIEINKVVYHAPESKSGYVRTGTLRNSLSHTSHGDAAYIGTNVEYAPYVEMGTIKMKARPYLKPAVMNHVDEYKQIVQSVMKG